MLLRSTSFGNEQVTPPRLRSGFCQEERRYIGNEECRLWLEQQILFDAIDTLELCYASMQAMRV